ncbi:hypothetical protein ASF69_18100 [Rhizobium sp. Leaf311]|nr:hypothetical protein ASF69_18100 [Rhizobium sp. Leaf311]
MDMIYMQIISFSMLIFANQRWQFVRRLVLECEAACVCSLGQWLAAKIQDRLDKILICVNR